MSATARKGEGNRKMNADEFRRWYLCEPRRSTFASLLNKIMKVQKHSQVRLNSEDACVLMEGIDSLRARVAELEAAQKWHPASMTHTPKCAAQRYGGGPCDCGAAQAPPLFTARLVGTEQGGWWGVFQRVDRDDYPNGVLVCTVCNHDEFFNPADRARRIAAALNRKGITT